MSKNVNEMAKCGCRVFSVELRSRGALRGICMTGGEAEGVLVEGTLGELIDARFEEGSVLEVVGRGGTLRVDLRESEIAKARGR